MCSNSKGFMGRQNYHVQLLLPRYNREHDCDLYHEIEPHYVMTYNQLMHNCYLKTVDIEGATLLTPHIGGRPNDRK